MPQKKRRKTTHSLHTLTEAESTGTGAAAAKSVGRKAKESALDVVRARLPVPPWAPLPALGCTPRAADVAAALEALRAEKLETLRGVLGTLCEASSLDAPPPQLSFERWRFGCAMHAEQAAADEPAAAAGQVEEAAEPAEAAGSAAATKKNAKKKKKKRPRSGTGQSSEPVVPSGGGDGGGLLADLIRAGLPEPEAGTLAVALNTAARAAAADVQREAAQYDTGAAVKSAPSVDFHKHSIDLTMGKHFVKLTREAYGKMCELHRNHAPANERLAPLVAETHGYEGAEADLAEAESGGTAKSGGKSKSKTKGGGKAAGGGGGTRAALHARLFAVLLRYKSLHGAGFQAACPPAVFTLLRERLGVAFEGFASPLNCHFPRHCSAFPDVDAPFGSVGSDSYIAYTCRRLIDLSLIAGPSEASSGLLLLAAHSKSTLPL